MLSCSKKGLAWLHHVQGSRAIGGTLAYLTMRPLQGLQELFILCAGLLSAFVCLKAPQHLCTTPIVSSKKIQGKSCAAALAMSIPACPSI